MRKYRIYDKKEKKYVEEPDFRWVLELEIDYSKIVGNIHDNPELVVK